MKRRVVVTGIGAITPIGLNIPDYWKALLNGTSGVDFIKKFDASEFKTKFAAEINNFDAMNYMDRKLSQRTDLFTQYAIAATQEAYKDSGLENASFDKERAGVIYGSGIGGMWTYDKQHTNLITRNGVPDRISPFFIPMLISDITPGRLSMEYGFKGPNYTTTSACATSAHSIIDATMQIQHNYADVMITGGSEAVICPMGVGGFNAMNALSTRNDDPKKASRPFDKNRDGFVMGEGAGTLILEEYEHAVKRGAKIYGEVAGFGMTADAHHITDPAEGGEGVVRALRLTIKDAGLTENDIDVINAHGTSTYPNDRNETAAIKTVFGERAYKIPVHSIKSMVGHLLGAAGAIEAITAILTIRDGKVPPTINYEEKDPECDLFYVPNAAIDKDVNVVISDNSGFGGHNAAIALKKLD
ncbi:MAG TPA: beta-ketoacyl-ACP synthase II [Ignavibacteria bacterium]|nr:beta-ketoacyl-ACP synthase II [Ignavibacteria bacterium]